MSFQVFEYFKFIFSRPWKKSKDLRVAVNICLDPDEFKGMNKEMKITSDCFTSFIDFCQHLCHLSVCCNSVREKHSPYVHTLVCQPRKIYIGRTIDIEQLIAQC